MPRLLDAASRTDLISGKSPNRRTTLGRVLRASTQHLPFFFLIVAGAPRF